MVPKLQVRLSQVKPGSEASSQVMKLQVRLSMVTKLQVRLSVVFHWHLNLT